MAAEAAADVEQNACDIRTALSMDLCSTEEMLSVFEGYYESDVKDMARSRINNACIETGVDVQAKMLALALVDRLMRCRCLTSTLVTLLVHGVI